MKTKTLFLLPLLSLVSGVSMAAELPSQFTLSCDAYTNYSNGNFQNEYRIEATIDRAQASVYNDNRIRLGFNVSDDERVTEVRSGSVSLFQVRDGSETLVAKSMTLSPFHEAFEIIPSRSDDRHGRLLVQFELVDHGTPVPPNGLLAQLELQAYYQIDAQGNLSVAPASVSNSFIGLVYRYPTHPGYEIPYSLRNCKIR